jgi:hypothetical protein
VIFIPTHPLKLLRGVPRLVDVTKWVLGGVATTVMVAAFEEIEPAVLLTTHIYCVPL